MKLKILMVTIAALNLTCAYSADEAALREHAKAQQTSIQVLSAENLQEAYQDFLSYYTQNAKMQASGIQPAILFAQELHERDEDELALMMLTDSTAVNLLRVSEKDVTVVQKIIRRLSSFDELDSPTLLTTLHTPTPNARQSFLKSVFDQIYPNYEELLANALLANSDDENIKAQSALSLFALMTDQTADIKFKIQAASLVVNVRKKDFTSFLEDAQLEQARVILTDAINDNRLHPQERYLFANTVLWSFNANHDGRLGTDEQRRDILDTLFFMAQNSSDDPELIFDCAGEILAVRPFGKNYTFLAPQTQREAALALIMDRISNTNDGIYKLEKIRTLLLCVFKDPEGPEDISGGSLASPEQRLYLMQILQDHLTNGRDWEKARAAQTFAWLSESEGLPLYDIKKEAKNLCFSALSSPYFTFDEVLTASRVILNIFDDKDGKYKKISSESERRTVLSGIIEMLDIPNLKPWQKANLIREILSTKDAQNKHLASPEEMQKAANFGMDLLVNEKYDYQTIAREIFELDNVQISNTQFQVIIPLVLENIKDAYGNYYWQEKLAVRLLEHSAATEEQRKEALGIFLNRLNDEKRSISDKQKDARIILYAKNASNALLATPEQLATARAVLRL